MNSKTSAVTAGLVFIYLLLTFFPGGTYAGEQNSCLAPDVHSITVPAVYGDETLGTFDFKVRLIERYPEAPVLVVIPGGPGGTSMRRDLKSYPAGFNLLLTDPRTIGCNAGNPPEAFRDLSTRTIASDIARAIDQLGLRSFVLYGSSYGTQVATLLAFQLENVDLLPQAVVLEGTSGPKREFLPGYNQVLHDMLNRLPESVAQQIRSIHADRELLGFSARTWAYFFLQMLPMGQSGNDATPLLERILAESFDHQSKEESRAVLNYMLSSAERESQVNDDAGESLFFLTITCQESYRVIPSDYILAGGSILASPDATNRCLDFELRFPYDPAHYLLRSPIWYFQGTEDPNTPLSGALYHFGSQTQAKRKTLVKIVGAGHAATASSPMCAKSLWEFVLRHEEYDDISDLCELPIEVQQE